MNGFYFERYRNQAAAALEGPMEQVSNSTLIQGIEDIGGVERTALAHAVPMEAGMLAQALREAGVEGEIVMERSPLIPVSGEERLGDDAPFERGWYLGHLVDGAPYTMAGAIRREDSPSAMLADDGTVYAYSSRMAGHPVANGIALNRYAPVCATSMNDRAVLFGLAVKAAAHDLEISRAS